jgi:hypothetical protein
MREACAWSKRNRFRAEHILPVMMQSLAGEDSRSIQRSVNQASTASLYMTLSCDENADGFVQALRNEYAQHWSKRLCRR